MKHNFPDIEVVEKLIYQYFDAVCRADVDALRTLFHDRPAMYGNLQGTSLAGTPEPFFEDLLSKPSMQAQGIDCRGVITHLAVTGPIATVTLLVDNFYGAGGVEDHFQLLKERDEWRIVCKTFTTL